MTMRTMMIITPRLIMFAGLLSTVCPRAIDEILMDAAETVEALNILVSPKGQMHVLVDWDMLIPMNDYLEMDANQDNNNSGGSGSGRKKRKAIKSKSYRWTDCHVYYEIESSIDTTENRRLIRDAMEVWEKYTCLDFSQSDTAKYRIQIRNGTGCHSTIGMRDIQSQMLVLGDGCMDKKTVIHEIGHAIGFYHEHQRLDRDEYVLVDKKCKSKANYIPNQFIDTFGIDYDLESIMHYRECFTLNPKYNKFKDTYGRAETLSFKDIKLANVMYDCAKVMNCPVSGETCVDEGFKLYKSFNGKPSCRCWCDSGNATHPLVLCSERKHGLEEEPPKRLRRKTISAILAILAKPLAPFSPL